MMNLKINRNKYNFFNNKYLKKINKMIKIFKIIKFNQKKK